MSHIKLNQGLRRIEVSKLEIENELAFAHFDRLPAKGACRSNFAGHTSKSF